MLGFGGHNWFKIRPVQTGGMTMRQNRDFQTYSHAMVQKNPGGRQNHWFLAFNIGTFFPFFKAYIGFKTGG